jgi:RNA polymerase sigma-B factor
VNRFDAEHGADFLAFAVPTMIGEVRQYFRDHGWSVKVPRRMKELGPQLNRARDDLSQRLGRAPTASEIASHLGIDHEEVVQALPRPLTPLFHVTPRQRRRTIGQ